MAAAATKFTFAATLFCVIMLWHGSVQMPVQARTRRSPCDSKLESPTIERDLLLGLSTMYRGAFANAWREADSQNLPIQISNTSKFQNVSASLCSLMMYSDFLEASSQSKNSSKLQALRMLLQENIRDGCSLLKNQSAVSNEVNFTTTQQAFEGYSLNQTECNNEDLESLRAYCLEQSLLKNFLGKLYSDMQGEIKSDCLITKGKCDWINRRFQEPERSIVVEQVNNPNLNCASS